MISNFQNQAEGLGLSLIFGIFLAGVYDILRITRKLTLAKKRIVFVMDVLFLSFCSLLTFIAAFSTNYGVLRLYHILGEALGAFLYFLTFGKITDLLTDFFLLLLREINAFIKKHYEIIKNCLKDRIKNKKMSKKSAKKLEKNKTSGV